MGLEDKKYLDALNKMKQEITMGNTTAASISASDIFGAANYTHAHAIGDPHTKHQMWTVQVRKVSNGFVLSIAGTEYIAADAGELQRLFIAGIVTDKLANTK